MYDTVFVPRNPKFISQNLFFFLNFQKILCMKHLITGLFNWWWLCTVAIWYSDISSWMLCLIDVCWTQMMKSETEPHSMFMFSNKNRRLSTLPTSSMVSDLYCLYKHVYGFCDSHSLLSAFWVEWVILKINIHKNVDSLNFLTLLYLVLLNLYWCSLEWQSKQCHQTLLVKLKQILTLSGIMHVITYPSES